MDLLSFIRSKLSKNNAFIGSLIIWSLFMPYYLFYLLNYDFDIDITWKHIFFIVSYYVLQICLMKTIPSDNLSISYIENSSYKNISIKNNGKYCSLITFLFFSIGYYLNFMNRKYILLNFIELITVHIFLSLCFCFYFYRKNNDFKNFNWYNFLWGTELFPTIFNTNFKILNNCRFGMTLWLIYIISFLVAHYEIHGYLTYSQLTTTILQSIYIFKFFIWEDGYYQTLDIMMDKIGWWLVYGCMVYVPMLYTFASHYFIIYSYDTFSPLYYFFILLIGCISIYINYITDMDKKVFKETNGKYTYNNKEARYLSSGKNKLLMSGLWGIVRKPNYVSELIIAFSFCCMHGFQSIVPYIYFIILFLILIFRIYIDEERCLKKYGNLYRRYMQLVPYRLIPFVF